MPVAFRSSSSAQDQTAATFAVTKPAGAADTDLLVAIQATTLGGGTAPATPSGWTLLDRVAYNTSQHEIAIFYKVVLGDGASYTFNSPGGSPLGNTSCVYITCWSGAASAPEAVTENTGSGTTATALSITTAQANEYLLGAYAIATNVGETITPNESQTSLGDLGTGATLGLEVGYVAQAAAGASGNKTATISGSVQWGAMLVAIPSGVTAPVAAFSGTPLSGSSPLSVVFTDASTNTPTSWLWEKNSGSGWVNFAGTPTAQNPTESFASGTWSVRLTATNAGGSDAEEKTNYITSSDSAIRRRKRMIPRLLRRFPCQ